MKKLEEMTNHEKTLRRIICSYRNEFIGTFENATYDWTEQQCEEYWPLQQRTKKYVVDLIYGWIMNTKDKYLRSYDDNTTYLETKHVRFMGSDFIRELIEDRVEYDFKKHGWPFEHNYYGTDQKDDAIANLKSHKYYHFKDANRERWFEIIEVKATTVKMKELSDGKLHNYKLEGDVLKEMIEDKTGTCEDEVK